ncbi:MAG TPA: UDP-N-acetylmuramoyl-L-alanine--D-glutamate ligase [Acidobacteriota bacterium]|nr:UDP-N-acetylmuramoyl-L-alanine--D-glutamate ligase [Acidobacteriota bacterium]
MDVTGKNILIVGAARSGLAAAEFLAARGAQVTVTDQRPESALLAETERMRAIGVGLDLGGHTDHLFVTADEIVISPGVPLTIAPLQKAAAAGVPIIGEIELAARYLKGRIVAITGSNGKTTTTTLIGKILADAGLPVQVGGNIGTAAIGLVAQSREDGFTVLETSSFQLETINTFRPQVALLLNVTPDHLDRYPSFEAYRDAKLQMFRNQGPDTLAVLNADDPSTPLALEHLAVNQASFVLFSRTRELEHGVFARGQELISRANGHERVILNRSDIYIRGDHNVENVLAAVCAALACGASPDQIRESIRTFHGVEHRLEWVTEVNQIQFFNDSKATNVDATIKAIEAFPGNLFVILGGKDKGSDYSPLVPLLNERARGVILIGAATERIATALEAKLDDDILLTRCHSMQDAVETGFRQAAPGEIILLAPACASFDMFDNFEHRGRVFKAETFRLKEHFEQQQLELSHG